MLFILTITTVKQNTHIQTHTHTHTHTHTLFCSLTIIVMRMTRMTTVVKMVMTYGENDDSVL